MGLSFERKKEADIEEDEKNINNSRIYVILSGKWKRGPLERVSIEVNTKGGR